MMRTWRRVEPEAVMERERRILRRLFSIELGVLLALLSVMLALVVFYAHYSGMVRWALLVFLLLLGGWLAGKYVYLHATEVNPLPTGPPRPRPSRGDLRGLSTTLRRGVQGMRYSQLAFALRMRDAFLEKVKAETGFEGETHELLDQMPVLRAFLRDDEIYRFIAKVTYLERSMADLLGSDREVFPGGASAFPDEMERVLRKMEAWP
jgi:hypothetical protein